MATRLSYADFLKKLEVPTGKAADKPPDPPKLTEAVALPNFDAVVAEKPVDAVASKLHQPINSAPPVDATRELQRPALIKPEIKAPPRPLLPATIEKSAPAQITVVSATPAPAVMKAAPQSAPKSQKTLPLRLQLVCFEIGGEEYGINIMDVQEINEKRSIHPMPNQPQYLMGITQVRNETVPVVDLAYRLGFKGFSSEDYPYIILVRVKGEVVGLAVENVTEVRSIDRAQLENAPILPFGGEIDYFDGIFVMDQKLLIILNIDKIISASEITDLSQAIDAAKAGIKGPKV